MKTLIENHYRHLGIELECYLDEFQTLITLDTEQFGYTFYKKEDDLFLIKYEHQRGIDNIVGIYQFEDSKEANQKALELQQQYLKL